jgi:hypothetical protein
MKVKVKGETVTFPDSMSAGEVQAALRKKFPKKEEIVKEVIKEVPKIVEKLVIKEIVKDPPKDQNIVSINLVHETLGKIEKMLSRPPVVVKEITSKPEIIIKEVERVIKEEVLGWSFEITERDRFGNIVTMEANPKRG